MNLCIQFTLCEHGHIVTVTVMDTSIRVHRTLVWGTLTWRIFTAVEYNNKDCEQDSTNETNNKPSFEILHQHS